MHCDVLGIDAQARGVAAAFLSFPDGMYVRSMWIPIDKGTSEFRIHKAFLAAEIILFDYDVSLAAVELPSAGNSSSAMLIWGIYGAVVAGLYPKCQYIEGIVPLSWKKYSGLNQWARDHNRAKNGIVAKQDVKEGIISVLPGVPTDLAPADIYDSIAIALAGHNRNLERLGNQS